MLECKGVDLRPRFRQRTELYASGGAPGTASILPGGKGASKGVPRTLGCAQCAGCGRRAWFAGDGRTMVPCAECGLVYYCSEACREVDGLGHGRLCAYSTGSAKWKQAPASDRAWVTNRAMLVGRRMLRRKGQQDGGAILQAMDKERRREQAREEKAAKQKLYRDKDIEKEPSEVCVNPVA